MCGINGIYNFAGGTLSDAEAVLRKMNARIAHRGPDGQGVWKHPEDKLLLGHTRLSIIDLSTSADQPMLDAQSRDALVFNGEIYNYQGLKKQFPNTQWSTSSDTEVLLRLLQRSGLKALQHCNGMFAFAYWKESERALYLGVDALGKKPLYYLEKNGCFAFSSEIKALLEIPWVSAQLDKEAFYHFLTFNQVAPPQTMFEGIKKLAPGETLRVSDSGVKPLGIYPQQQSALYEANTEREWADLILDKFKESVQQRMVSDVPVGAFLSGGVDSSAVVAEMSAQGNKAISTFTIGFENQPDYDERRYASEVAQHFGTQHHEKVVRPDEVEELIAKVAYIFDEPMADTTGIPIYFLAKSAYENGIKVVLTGDGADEMFLGYRSWLKYTRFEKGYHRFKKLPRPVKSLVANSVGALKPNHAAVDILARAVDNREFFWGGAKSFKESVKRKFLHKDFFSGLGQMDSYSVIEHYKKVYNLKHESEENVLRWMSFLGMEFLIPNWYMHRMDKLGMANSIEIRSPIVDTQLRNLAMACPPELKVKGGEPKYIFKKAMEGLLDQDVLYRKKKGFCLPIQEWGSGIMLDFLDKHAVSFCRETNLLNEISITEQINRFKKNQGVNINDMFTLYYIINWYQQWLY